PVALAVEREATAAERPAAIATPARAPAPLRVLFVDDSIAVRKIAERALSAMGAQVTVAVDGLDALAKLRERPVDIVLTDVEMPPMHGFELLRELRAVPAYRELPIIVLSSRSGKKHHDEAVALGASQHLTKPFTAQTLGQA